MASIKEIEEILKQADNSAELSKQMSEHGIGFWGMKEAFRRDSIAYLNVAKYLVKNL